MDVRLIGPSKNIGRVEVLYGNTWVPVCHETMAIAPNTDNPWTDLAASVACKQLGFEAGGMALPNLENKGLSSSTGYRVNDVICEDGEFIPKYEENTNLSSFVGYKIMLFVTIVSSFPNMRKTLVFSYH